MPALPLFQGTKRDIGLSFRQCYRRLFISQHLHRVGLYTPTDSVFAKQISNGEDEHTSHKDDCGRHRPDVKLPGYPGKGLGIHVVGFGFCFSAPI